MIETERLLIRPFFATDVDELYCLVYADFEVRDAWSDARETPEAFRRRFSTSKLWHAEDGFGFRALLRKEDKALMGLMGFQRYTPDEDTSYIVFENGSSPVGCNPNVVEVELTYALGRPYWKQGYATEAGKALIAEGFACLGIHRIINAVSPLNLNSINLMKRLGFRILPNYHPGDLAKYGRRGVLGILENHRKDKNNR
ncbi:MAG TPA: GNAT family N-acetyltransferase [Chthonomonadaceae bacterium]|nr:GNAT family N-acetyltransferase [Chthonomonadaceae bacterium]